MYSYLALASLKAYSFDLLVWATIGIVLVVFLGSLFKRSRLFLTIFGAALILSSIPIASMAEIKINGCCGAPKTGYEGAGVVIGAILVVIGITILVFRKKLVKKHI